MKQVNDDWDGLAVCAQKGDKEAYRSLLTLVVPYIRKIIAPGLANPAWQDDLLQDILLGIHKSLPRYMPGQPFRPWLNAIIRYRRAEFFNQYYASHEHMQSSLEDVEEHGTEQANWLNELEDLERLLSHLPKQQQELFRLVRVEGYSIKEVAAKMDMSESAVKVSVHRSATKLKDILNQNNK